jgi:uncharacterized damage-inducible protein DinB
MKSRRAFALMVLSCAVLAAAPAAHAADTMTPGVRGEILASIHDAETKLTQLAEATPAAKYTWRPGEGVRSTGEVFMHVAGANYLFPSIWGAKVPAGKDMKGMQAMEKDGADKAKTMAALKESFAFITDSIKNLSDADLDKPVEFFGRKGTVRSVLIIAATHTHEHLGQSIAYARSNGIAPPWSKKGD